MSIDDQKKPKTLGAALREHIEGETLAKVLPGGGPLLPGRPAEKIPVWECSRCRMRSLTPCRDECLQGHNTDCPMVGGYVR